MVNEKLVFVVFLEGGCVGLRKKRQNAAGLGLTKNLKWAFLNDEAESIDGRISYSRFLVV